MTSARLIAAVASLSFVMPAYAALPPQHQRTAELKAILDNSDVAESFMKNGHLVDRVEYVSRDLYRVTGGNCALNASIVEKPLPDGMVGARQFDVVLSDIVCSDKEVATDGEAS